MSGDGSPTAVTQTFVFADLAGYSALTEAHGDEQAADAAAAFCTVVRALLDEHDTEEVKAIGDALMLRSSDAPKAAGLAERIISGYGARHLELGVGIGMHTGTAVRRGNDWFGSAVNIASRVADVAQAGQVYCTGATREALGPAAAVRARGERSFKNVVTPMTLYELVLSRSGETLPVDPVCRMAIEPAQAVSRCLHGSVEYLFCSQRCADAFDRAPATYASTAAQRP